jgi:hypothetical protein
VAVMSQVECKKETKTLDELIARFKSSRESKSSLKERDYKKYFRNCLRMLGLHKRDFCEFTNRKVSAVDSWLYNEEKNAPRDIVLILDLMLKIQELEKQNSLLEKIDFKKSNILNFEDSVEKGESVFDLIEYAVATSKNLKSLVDLHQKDIALLNSYEVDNRIMYNFLASKNLLSEYIEYFNEKVSKNGVAVPLKEKKS